MKVITFILFFILFYFAFKGIRFLMSLFGESRRSDNRNSGQNSNQANKSSIDKKDIIEAEFEDIDESEKNKKNPT